MEKQRHYFANKGPSSQGYGFSYSHVWMWMLDYKESWALKNWCFWTVVFEKSLESPLDCKEIQPVHPRGDGWMASLTQWTWVWVDSDSWWWIGRPGVLQFMGSQRVGHDWETELKWYRCPFVLLLWTLILWAVSLSEALSFWSPSLIGSLKIFMMLYIKTYTWNLEKWYRWSICREGIEMQM